MDSTQVTSTSGVRETPTPVRHVSLITRTGPLKTALEQLVRALPALLGVQVLSGLEWMTGGHPLPALALIEEGAVAARQLSSTIELIRQVAPRCYCLVLVTSQEARQDAERAGADLALFHGYRASELADLLETLLIHADPEELNPA